jgi:hypothetical protein
MNRTKDEGEGNGEPNRGAKALGEKKYERN